MRVTDGDTITILDEARAKSVELWVDGCDDFDCHLKMEVR